MRERPRFPKLQKYIEAGKRLHEQGLPVSPEAIEQELDPIREQVRREVSRSQEKEQRKEARAQAYEAAARDLDERKLPLTQTELARQLTLSRERVRQVLRDTPGLAERIGYKKPTPVSEPEAPIQKVRAGSHKPRGTNWIKNFVAASSHHPLFGKLRDTYGLQNSYRRAVVIQAIQRENLTESETSAIIEKAYANADKFMSDLVLQTNSQDVEINSFGDLYRFGKDYLLLSELETYTLLKLKRATFTSIKNAISSQYIPWGDFAQPVADRVSDILEQSGLGSGKLKKSISSFLARRILSPDYAANVVTTALEKADPLISHLSKEKLITSNILTVRGWASVYEVAKKDLDLSPEVVHVIFKLKRVAPQGVRYPDFPEYRGKPPIVSLDQPLTADSETPLGSVIGKEEEGFERFENKQLLEAVLATKLLSEPEEDLLKRIIIGEDLEDESYKTLAAAIERHPALMELINAGEIK